MKWNELGVQLGLVQSSSVALYTTLVARIFFIFAR